MTTTSGACDRLPIRQDDEAAWPMLCYHAKRLGVINEVAILVNEDLGHMGNEVIALYGRGGRIVNQMVQQVVSGHFVQTAWCL